MEFPINPLRAPFRIPRNSETMELDEEPEMPTGIQQESEAVTPEGASEETQQGSGVQMEIESNHHDTGAPQGGARTDGSRGTNSVKVTDFLNNPHGVLSTTHARRPPRESVDSRWEAVRAPHLWYCLTQLTVSNQVQCHKILLPTFCRTCVNGLMSQSLITCQQMS